MEKIPGLRVVGGASEERKLEAKKEQEEQLINHISKLPEAVQKVIKSQEYLKSESEIALIQFVNEEINYLRKELGLAPHNIPFENYHLLPTDVYEAAVAQEDNKKGRVSARTLIGPQAIIYDAKRFRSNSVYFGLVTFHETLHLNGHLTLEVEETEKKARKSVFRWGMDMNSSQSKARAGEQHIHFRGLHEAIVSKQESLFVAKMMDSPVLTLEKKRLESETAKNLIKHIARKRNISPAELFWVGENENEALSISYPRQRQVLNYACEEIQKEFPDRYYSADEVFKEFLKAHFTGQALSIARLMKTTFGNMGFRTLGDMKVDNDGESAILCLEHLKKLKAERLKK